MKAKYYCNGELFLEEDYIFKRLYKSGQTIIVNYENITIINSEIVDGVYIVNCDKKFIV